METTQYLSAKQDTCIEAYTNIRKGAVLDRTYIIMNILATIIACYGLLANSPAVVIGAMVVAMLLGPIIGIALGVVEADNVTLRKSIVSEILGILIVYLTALIIGFIHINLLITDEILARTAPNFIDLMIALAGGAAGAYALISPRMGLSLVGVAVAIALVPPLSSSAILLARGDFTLAGGAALLALTNIVAIEFAAAIVLLIFKCTREPFNFKAFIKSVPRYSLSIVVLMVLSFVLINNLQRVVTDQTYKTQSHQIIQQQIGEFPGAYLEDVRYETTPSSLIVRAVVRGPFEFSPQQVATITAKLPTPPNGLTMDFRLRFVLTTVVTSNGIIFNDSSSLIK